MENAAISINMESVVSTVVATVITMLIAVIGKAALSWAMTLKQKLASEQHRKVPMKLRIWTRHFTVMACLLWMLQATLRASAQAPSPTDVAMISAWTWAVLSYVLHIVRED
jgi:uncharacterized membrane protein